MSFKFRANLIALVVALLLVGGFSGGWLYRTNSQASAVVTLKEFGVDINYQEPESFIEAYPIIKEKFSHDFYANVEVVTLPKKSETLTDIEQIIPALKSLPNLKRIQLHPTHEEMVSKLKSAIPSVECEIIKGELATPSAGGR